MAWPLLGQDGVINPDRGAISFAGETTFWSRLLSDAVLRQCEDLEKLLIGCEIIAALDDLTLLESLPSRSFRAAPMAGSIVP